LLDCHSRIYVFDGVRPDAETGVGDTSEERGVRMTGGDNVVTISEQSTPPNPS